MDETDEIRPGAVRVRGVQSSEFDSSQDFCGLAPDDELRTDRDETPDNELLVNAQLVDETAERQEIVSLRRRVEELETHDRAANAVGGGGEPPYGSGTTSGSPVLAEIVKIEEETPRSSYKWAVVCLAGLIVATGAIVTGAVVGTKNRSSTTVSEPQPVYLFCYP